MNTQINSLLTKAKKDRTILAIALFGSYARNETYNDIDICIFLKPATYTKKKLSEKKLEYTSENSKIDVSIFQQLPLYIKERVIQEGKFIYGKDVPELYDLCFEMMRELGHYKPFYEEYLAAVAHG